MSGRPSTEGSSAQSQSVSRRLGAAGVVSALKRQPPPAGAASPARLLLKTVAP